jgi:hypothetical protein
MVDIPDDEYAFLQARRQIADLVEPIYNDPQLSKEAKRLLKRKYPQLQIPDYDIEEKFNERFDAERKAREDAEAATQQKRQDEEFQASRKKVQADYGFTDEAMGELEDMMRARNIGDYEAAAVYKASRDPKPIEPTYDSHFWRHEKQDGFKDIAADPEGWARREILGAINRDENVRRGGR